VSEFPNDNPDLWRAWEDVYADADVHADAHADAHAAAHADADADAVADAVAVADADADSDADSDDVEVEVEVLEFAEEDFAAIENESIPPPAPPDLFHVYVRTLVEVALAAGAPGRVVEVLPAMLGLTRLEARALDDAAIDALVAADLLARTESGAVVRSASLTAAAQAWRSTLLGEEADFSACTSMLDEWSAQLVATLAGTPAQKEALRRELRARGVAAFGMLVDDPCLPRPACGGSADAA